jgi:hypothetical protein
VCSLGSPQLTAKGAQCNVLHATDGWLYISFPASGKCCKCTDDPSMGLVRPDWLRHPETQFLGVESVNGAPAQHWFLEANYTAYDNHYYCTDDDRARPVRFLEHVGDAGGRPKLWDFNLAAFQEGDQFPLLLAAPAKCDAGCAVLANESEYPGCTWTGPS